MEIKTSQEIYEQVKSTLNDKGWIDEEIIARVAMRSFAKQFIDLAAEKADVEFEENEEIFEDGESKGYFRNPIIDKKSILDIKQLIK